MATNNITGDIDKIISYRTLRKAIGWLGMLLPFMLIAGTIIINRLDILNSKFFVNTDCSEPYSADGIFKISISRYYYSAAGELFTALLCAVALFMFCYKGHPKREFEKGLSDKALTDLIGISALGVVFFPTGAEECINDNVRTFLITTNAGYIHYIFALMFFVSLALMLIINFRRTKEKELFGKKENHKLYLFCGIGILVCILLIFIYTISLTGSGKWIEKLNPIFWLETIALILFGISWLKKGKADFEYILKILKLKKPITAG